LEAFHLPADDGVRFCICHRAAGTPRGSVLYLHPLAEEMNKSRRMATLQARSLAKAGYTVLLMDLLGCGDSSGDFADATWSAWTQDAMRGLAWLRDQAPGPCWAWGLRAGCLLAAEAAGREGGPDHLLLWQPPASGKQVLQQLVRLRSAMEALDGTKGASEAIRRQWLEGLSVDIAGYVVGPALAAELELATMTPPRRSGQLHWIELSSADPLPEPSPVTAKAVAAWQAAGWVVASATRRGPAFWQSTEVEQAPDLIEATLASLGGAAS
jgi:exosortase A-associated hydrolase 2